MVRIKEAVFLRAVMYHQADCALPGQLGGTIHLDYDAVQCTSCTMVCGGFVGAFDSGSDT